MTTTSPSPETAANPWDLPLEERPALFDPCTEIPIDAVEEGLGGPVQVDEALLNHQSEKLHTCAWRDGELLYVITVTWLDKRGFLDDPEFGEIDTEAKVFDRPSFQMRDSGDTSGATCYRVFFTSRGAAVANVNLMKSMGQYRGDTFVDSCDILNESIGPIIRHLPAGDF